MTSSDGVLNIRALVIEDDPVWRKIHKNTLTANNCEHIDTDDIDFALKYVKENYVQLAIIDLDLSRAKKHGDTPSNKDDEGKQLIQMIVKNKWLDKMVVCVVSHWSDIGRLEAFKLQGVFGIDQMRPNLASGIEVDGIIYFSKNEYDPTAFWERIEKELRSKDLLTGLNTDEEIIIDMLSARMTRNLIEHIESKSEHSRLSDHDEWIKEVFDDEEGIGTLSTRLQSEIKNLLLLSVNKNSEDFDLRRIGHGFSKASVVRVSSLLHGKWTNEVIIKSGYHREIANEWKAYEGYVGPLITRRPPAKFGPKTPILSSIVYDYVGDAHSFESCYKRYSQADIEKILEDLFKVACDSWYSVPTKEGRLNAHQYMDYLHCYPERFKRPLQSLEQAPEGQGSNLQGETITFAGIDDTIPNPVKLLQKSELFETYPAFFATTHGDFNANNILVIEEPDGSYKTIMIDFARTGEAHILRDFIQLEAVIKFVLLDKATLAERYELEAALLKQGNFADIDNVRQSYQATGKNAKECQRAFDTVCKIRELAWEVALKGRTGKPIYHFEQYRMGLFFLSLNTVRFLRSEYNMSESVTDGISPTQALHALLAAGMLVERLVGSQIH